MSNFPKCCMFVRPLYGRFNHPRIFDHRSWTTSLSSIHGQRPRTTLLSSKGDLVSYKSYSRSITFLSLLGWFPILSALLDMDNPYGRIGDELISRYPIIYIYIYIYVCVERERGRERERDLVTIFRCYSLNFLFKF